MLDSLNYGCIRGFLTSLYHKEGTGRKPYNPVSMLKAQLLKHLWRVPSDRRLSLLLKRNMQVARACGFRKGHPVMDYSLSLGIGLAETDTRKFFHCC